MTEKQWKDRNIKERIGILSDIQNKTQEKIKKRQEIGEEKRRKLLGLKEGEKDRELEYKFSIPEIEKNKAKKILENIGKERYQNKEERYQIFNIDISWVSWYAELRWPYNPFSWIESTKIYDDGKVRIGFLTSNKTKSLEKEAQQIFEKIKEIEKLS